MANGFSIDKNAVRKLTKELEREFAKNPVRVPLEAEAGSVALRPATTVNNYHGPVVNVEGGHAQIAWGNNHSVQNQKQVEQIAAGYEELARLVTDLLAGIENFALNDEDQQEVRATAETVLSEVVKEEPTPSVIKRGMTLIKGLLAPVAAGISSAATEESAEAARNFIHAVGQALS
jgi:hypothetical protein